MTVTPGTDNAASCRTPDTRRRFPSPCRRTRSRTCTHLLPPITRLSPLMRETVASGTDNAPADADRGRHSYDTIEQVFGNRRVEDYG